MQEKMYIVALRVDFKIAAEIRIKSESIEKALKDTKALFSDEIEAPEVLSIKEVPNC